MEKNYGNVSSLIVTFQEILLICPNFGKRGGFVSYMEGKINISSVVIEKIV